MKKVIVIGVITLFIVVGFQSAFAVEPNKSSADDTQVEEDIEPKDYLFETIIEIINNPDIKELIEEYSYNIFKIDYNFKGIYLQILFNNPKLLFSLISPKPKVTYDNLNSAYDDGCEVVDIIGWDKSLEVIKSVKFSNPDIVDEFHNIILDDEELSNRISILEELNEEDWDDTPIICAITMGILMGGLYGTAIAYELIELFNSSDSILLNMLLFGLWFFFYAVVSASIFIGIIYDCISFP